VTNEEVKAELEAVASSISTAVVNGKLLPPDTGLFSLVFRQDKKGITIAFGTNVAPDHVVGALVQILQGIIKEGQADGNIEKLKSMEVDRDGNVTHYGNDGKPLARN